MAGVALLAHGVVARAHQVAHGLVGDVGRAHRLQVTRAGQARQQQRIAPVGLDALTWGAWDG
jgi:hypothetical protein